ncbi:MAG: TIGR03111 family XrtG-associated glycosyltransferase, partial [Sarcina sp.]
KLNSKTKIWWLESNNGKSLALNKGLYLATGQYIFNIDSDGYLHKDALVNTVTKFESDNSISAITGTVLINSDSIKKAPHFFNKLLKKCETFEYAESFLVGRAFQSNIDSIFSMAGAFSAFRKDSIIKTQLYNQKTLGEDLHMTSQIRSFIKGRILLATDAYMFLDSISDFNSLYKQRQRWQIGQIESANLFNNKNNKKTFNIFRLTLFKDHTLVFSRMIWLFASIYLLNIAYDYKSFILVNLILYITYCFVSLFNFFTIKVLLKNCPNETKYFNKNIFIILLMPFYRILTFTIRYIGILNAFKDTKDWNIKDLNTELKEIKNYILRTKGRSK